MKKQQRIMIVLMAVLLAAAGIFLFTSKQEPLPTGNLIKNGDFSAVTDGQPDGWSTGMWVNSPGASYLEAVTLDDGTTAILVENAAANDARFEQTVPVREKTVYRLSARVRAEGCGEDEKGANLSFSGIYGTSVDLHDTDGAWQEITLYARTGEGVKEATVMARLGGYGSENTGRAYFTDVKMEAVEDVPIGESVLDLRTPAPPKKSNSPATIKDRSIPLLLVACGLYVALSALIILKAMNGKKSGNPAVMLVGILGLAFIVRFALSFFVEGYGVDMGCFSAWAGRMKQVGPAGFYADGYFCDYPPAYMLVLGVLGQIASMLHISTASMQMQVLMKLVPILCDIVLAALLYVMARKRMGEPAALGLGALMALNPAFIVTSGCWGQIDSVLTVLLVLMLVYASEGKWHAAIPLFALAVLVKPQAGLLVPLGIAALLKERKTQKGKSIAAGMGFGVLVTLFIVLLFAWGQNPVTWLFDKYTATLSGYPHATLSTGNLMFLLGGNWVNESEALFGAVTYGQVGLTLMILSFAAGIAVYLLSPDRKNLLLSAALTLQLVFVLGTKMHERYVIPALALLFFAYVETGDLRVLVSGILASAASALNIGIVLAYDYLVAPHMGFGYAISVVQLAAAALTVWAAVDLVRGRPAKVLPERKEQEEKVGKDDAASSDARTARMRRELLQPQDYRLHLRGVDYAVMLSLTAIYAAVGFYHLGAVKAPQTGYASTAPGESVVFDLGDYQDNMHVYYYGGISDTAFSVAVSDDGELYGPEMDAFFDRGECFKWLALRRPTYDARGNMSGVSGGMVALSGRYVRLTFEDAGADLWEVGFVDENGHALPIASVTSSGGREGRTGDPMTLADEQDTVPDKPSYYNSMYFDEIYHARTGYEHAHALPTYETTHPPLGKVFMSWCIRAFGMTPFAWRFAGALTGVLMIPAIYLLAMQLFGATHWAGLSALLLAADCMHYTQTRIATIDSFPVLFMMLMFLFMARWMKMSFFHQKLSKTFVPLALSGVFMALAISSKWIGCYGAVGLALLFFARFFALAKQAVYARKHEDENPAFKRAADGFIHNAVCTLAACVLFFVIIPIVIYVLSYIPYLRTFGNIKWNFSTIQRIWDAQVLMFDYHHTLVAEHFFSSPWYEWPLIVKPMWYFHQDFPAAGKVSSILAFGNPAVWWTGLVGILFVLGYSLYQNALPVLGVVPGRDDEYDRAMPVIAVGFLSAYLPWVLVSRLTFIYHYFASVPFIILATAQALRYLERRNQKAARIAGAVLAVAAVVLFAAFYPLASGMEVPRAWCDAVNWFEGWMWY